MSSELDKLRDYTLIICEKPDAARRVAEALKEDKLAALNFGRVEVFLIRNMRNQYVVCSALGHLYTVEDPARKRHVYPIFDIDWFPTSVVNPKLNRLERRIEIIKRLARKALVFINSCDFDLEGETIGYNVLKYACEGKQDGALRAKFSTLTQDDIRQAFSNLRKEYGLNLAEAGRTRHAVDFVWGVNLSRALSEAFFAANRRYRMVTVGRVQGPTLWYVIDREMEVRTFVPIPYWNVTAVLQLDGIRIEASYANDRVQTLKEADEIRQQCEGKDGTVVELKKITFRQPPPNPFNIGDLQKEAYRVFGFSPSQTLSIAERLYLNALVSYPRTSSQKLPPSIDYHKIINGLRAIREYRQFSDEVLLGHLAPRQGPKEDPAHPAIYPTGESPRGQLNAREVKLFDLIVRRFFAAFSKEALRERLSVLIRVGKYDFKILGRRTLDEGWLRYYGTYSGIEDASLPPLDEGARVRVVTVNTVEKFEQHPPHYNQASLLEKMEDEGVGTKTTRAEIISTLYSRGYITGESIVATDIGFSVVEAMKLYSPSIISSQMTNDVERQLERIERGEITGEEVLEDTVSKLIESLSMIKNGEVQIGREIREALISTVRSQNLLGPCPVCRIGKLTIIRSRRTGKRFVGCTNYTNGCRASAPLPQRGQIRTTAKLCATCGWPIVYVKLSRIPWRLCVNLNCPDKSVKRREVQALS